MQISPALFDRALHKKVLMLAIPMVLSNISVPLLGLVDSAVIGHLPHAYYLGGVALGSTLLSVTFWLFGFLRMSTTGLTAQAYGANDLKQLGLILCQGLAMAFGFALLFLLIRPWLADWIFAWSDASQQVKLYGEQYFSIRAWSAPAALGNFVLLGWLLGTQNSRAPMWMVILSNLTNIVLDLWFVVGLDWQVQGAALASVIADYTAMAFGLWCVIRTWRRHAMPPLRVVISDMAHDLVRFVRLNRDIFLRSLCLQAAFSFMTFQGAAFGDDIVAANAVLMSFLMIISYAMDGFAYAMEALVGKAIGAKDHRELTASMLGVGCWAVVISALLVLGFAAGGSCLIQLITDIPSVQYQARIYLPWLMAMPLVAMWCFVLDGVFIGATKGREMRNGMLLAA